MWSVLTQLKPICLAIIFWISGISFFIPAGVFYCFLSLFIPVHYLHPLVKIICRIMLRLMGQKVSIKHRQYDLNKSYIYMFNHTSILDSFLMILVLPTHTAAIGKAEQFKIPLWGWVLKRWV